MVHSVWLVVVALILGAVGFGIGYFIRKSFAEAKISGAETEAKAIVTRATAEAEALKKNALVGAKDEVHQMRNESERELRDRRSEVQRQEQRILQKEEVLDKKLDALERREDQIVQRESHVAQREKQVDDLYKQAEHTLKKQTDELYRIANLTKEEAKRMIMVAAEEEARVDAVQVMRQIERQAKEDGEKLAREIITTSLQRCASEHVAETTVSVVSLPADEMKGRIIGREGRNIRAFETLSGIDLIIDDTPEAVILSGFDPVRREIARLSLERLVADGRIHPARIEETIEKARKDIDDKMREFGEQAVFDIGAHGVHPDLIKLLGRLKYRTSYSQNVLNHSLEVAHLSGLMAAELGQDTTLARRAGLFHDIGKAMDHEIDGSHVDIGVELARKYKEHPVVINSIASHHGDTEATSIIAAIVAAADTLSAARPGARRETLDTYIKRLQRLEEITESFDGVLKSYAIQAGREVRVIVQPDVIDDAHSYRLAKNISKKIEAELNYPGYIKVTVIRETRAVEYAR
jgi:ribonuclease Y